MFKGYHDVGFVDASIMNIIDGTTTSNTLAASIKAAHVCCIRFDMMLINNKGLLPLLVNPSIDVVVPRIQEFTHREDPGLNIFSMRYFYPTIDQSDVFVKKPKACSL